MSCGSEDCHELPTITSRLIFVACRGGRRSIRGRSTRAIYLRRPGRSLHRDWQSHSIMPARRPSTTDASATALCFQGPWRRCAQEGRFGPALCSTERAKPGAKCCARTQLLRSSWSLDATIKQFGDTLVQNIQCTTHATLRSLAEIAPCPLQSEQFRYLTPG